ncbi:MAG: ABC transporter permease [Mesorhizobium sp.]|uniref:ABC transporter permease n=1 Tax=Mesorhizobium sp. TaxID=1871066 RepID=UPI000FE75A4D|nr:ABC transporter permease [Mesorhizobium sp.]RWE22870.1 MAG: ABC transporter permease [Mesorhizobium sp.]
MNAVLSSKTKRASKWRDEIPALDSFLAPLIVLAAVFLSWEYSSRWFGIPKYILPPPSDFLGRFATDSYLLASNALATGYVVLMGFVLAAAIAVPLGLAIASYASLRHGLLPVIVFFEIIPKTITAPLLIVWLGFGLSPRIALTTVMSVFPILVNSIAGFSGGNPRLFLLTKSMGASPWQTFRFVRLPAAMPYIFSGLKIGMVYAVTGCVTAEFVAANEGLASLIITAFGYADLDLGFAAIIATAGLGLAFTGVLLGMERLFMPWKE